MAEEPTRNESAQEQPATDELQALGERVHELIESLDNHSDLNVRMQVDELLEAIDRLHREAFYRLAGLLSHHQLLTHACADPVVGMAFELYDMRPEEIAGEDTQAAGAEAGAAPASPLVPSAPASRLVRTPQAASRPSGFIRVDDIRRIPAAPAVAPPAVAKGPAPAAPPRTAAPAAAGTTPEPRKSNDSQTTGEAHKGAQPHKGAERQKATEPHKAAEPPVAATGNTAPEWTELFGAEHVPPGSMAASSDAHVLVCNVDGTLHALRNRCGGGPLPLHLGKFVDGGVTCPWHRGCRYDLDTGESTSGRRTVVYPVRAENGSIAVALNQGRASGPLQPADLRAAPM